MDKAMVLESREKRVEKLNILLTFGEDACFLLYSLYIVFALCMQLIIARPNMHSLLFNTSNNFLLALEKKKKKKD